MTSTLRVLMVAAGAAAAAALLWWVPAWEIAPWRDALLPHQLIELQNQIRQTVAVGLAALAVLAGFALLWRRVAASERTALAALRMSADTQRGERFTAAVGQLADARLEVRLGAIYALEQLAADSPRQHAPAMEVLCAFLRERAAWDEDRPQTPRLPTDVQAVLTVIGRRAVTPAGGELRLDLRRTDLRGADLNGVHLARAILFEAHLDHATLQAAHLAGADLRGASLQGADLGGAHLDGAYLYKANLEGASLHGARAMSSIGVHRDERERINRTAADPPRKEKPQINTDKHGSVEGAPDTPAARPVTLRRAKR
jgi:hypothetical protein